MRVRLSRSGEKATLLFRTAPIRLPENTIVIADDKKILAVAGVIGCESAKPDEDTINIFFESALFDPVAVRIAARAIGEQTHASKRFERGGDPAAVTMGAERARHLLEKAGWGLASAEAPRLWTQPAPCIELSVQRLNRYLGTDMNAKDVTAALAGYGFTADLKSGTADTYDVSVPPHRIWDVKQPCDLYEEVCRKKGYGNLPSEMPASLPVGNTVAMAELELKKKVEEQLVGQGFYEVFTDGFYGEAQRSKMSRLDRGRAEHHVTVINSQESSYSLLKNNAVAQFLDIVKINANMRKSDIKVYEWTRVFTPDSKAENGLCNERPILWIGASGEAIQATWANEPSRLADVYFMKGLAERVFEACRLQVDIEQTASSDQRSTSPSEWMLHPARKARILHEQREVGVIGEIHPRLLYAWDISETRPVYIEINRSFLNLKPTPASYVPPAATLPFKREICFLMPPGMNARKVVDSLEEALDGAGEVTVLNVYKSTTQTEGRNAVTFSLIYDQGRVTAADVNKVTEHAAEQTLTKFKIDGLVRR
jgi:phenylalanyl-tRNA synthetase beta chain